MNQVTNLKQYKNLSYQVKKDHDWRLYKYEVQDSFDSVEFMPMGKDGPFPNGVYRLNIEADKWYFIADDSADGVYLGSDLFNDADNIDTAVVLRPATADEIPEPEAKEDRVKAEYSGFDVVMLEPDISSILSLPNGQYHVIAQSMRGFYKYVYFDGSEFYTCREPTDEIDDKIIHPVAVLFSKVKS